MSDVSAVSSSTYSMWTRIPREDGMGPKASDSFKLAGMNVLQGTGQTPALPLAHIWQGAVQFEQDVRDRQLIEAANKRSEQRTLALGTQRAENELLTGQATETSRALAARTEGAMTSQTSTASRARYTLGANRTEPQDTLPGYSAQGNWAKSTSTTFTRLGTIVDLSA